MKKRIIAVLSLILAIIIGIGGCGFTPDNKTSSADSSNITIDNESNNASTVSSNNESLNCRIMLKSMLYKALVT